MDEHYQAVYDRCRAALAKLEKRKIEVEKLNKDLAQTADNLKSANSALIVSENVFVRLRAQAFNLQTKCSTFYGDLDVLHDHIGTMKQMFVHNDHLVGEFANDHIERLKRQQSVLNQYTDESCRRMEKSEAMAVDIDKQTGCSSMELIQTFAGMGKEMEDFKSAADNTLATLRADVEKAQSRLQSFVGACQDRMQQQIAIISKHTELVQEGTRAIEHAGGEQRTMTMYMRDKLSTAFSESQAATEQFLHQDYRRFQDTVSVDLWTVCAVFAALFSCAFLWPKYHRLEYEQNAIFLHLLPPTFGDISGGNSATTNGMLLFPFAAATTKCDKKDDNKAEKKKNNNNL